MRSFGIKNSCRITCSRCGIRCGDYGSKSVSMYDQINHLKNLRATTSHYSEHPQDMQVSTIKRVNAAHEHFQRRCREGTEKKGYPKFKRSVRSLTWELRKYKRKTGERVRQNPIRETGTRYNRLKVPKLGEVKIRQHRPHIGDPKEVTLKKTARGWYVFIVCEVPDTLPVCPEICVWCRRWHARFSDDL